ncbi:MAG: rhodanese-like domain-containing protein [Elusimicrobia bacterium]|nr:rhodanese-like domain-containing protein [Elusimicrobiota bacterium]
MPATMTEQTAAEYFKSKLRFETTPHQLKADLEKGGVHVIDVRDRESYQEEHIPGAQNIPLEELSGNLRNLPKDKTMVTYCWNLTCALATKAALQLAEKGYKVQELVGGIEEWKKKDFPVERKAS